MKLTKLPSWQALSTHQQTTPLILADLFSENKDRFEQFSLKADNLFLDYSKNQINKQTLDLLFKLAEEREVDQLRKAMFQGQAINFTEQRAALHTALRNRSDRPVMLNNEDLMPAVRNILQRLEQFSEKVRNGEWLGFSGKPITHIVNIGIGGSHLGPMLVTDALGNFANKQLQYSFVSNTNIKPTLDQLDPETCLFIIVSKTFTTQETLDNAERAKEWLSKATQSSNAIKQHFVAVSSNQAATSAFGIEAKNVFEFWDWVGGRYSLWSAVGLVSILIIGMKNYLSMLDGANRLDEHFLNAPLKQNMPVIMALIGIWNINFLKAQSQAIIPYDSRLRYLPAHLQQLDMESNGKSVSSEGQPVEYSTGPVIFGSPGTDCQHAYFQSIHQGSQLIPVDFIAALKNPFSYPDQHENLLANCFAQSEALMRGKDAMSVRAELTASGHTGGEIELRTAHKIMTGNRPSNTLLMNELDPASLGALIALYEHKVFVQGVIWKINSFDQWGVELGKQMTVQVKLDLNRTHPGHHDSSTTALMQKARLGKI